MISWFNVEQAAVFRVIYNAVTGVDRTNTWFYLHGKVGSANSYIALELCAKLRSEGHVPVISGTTALSLTTYERRRTAHSTFCIPIALVCQLYLRYYCVQSFWQDCS
jgi:hypothetical protein